MKNHRKVTDSAPLSERSGYMSQEYPRATHAAMVTSMICMWDRSLRNQRDRSHENTLIIIFTSDNDRTAREAVIGICSIAHGI